MSIVTFFPFNIILAVLASIVGEKHKTGVLQIGKKKQTAILHGQLRSSTEKTSETLKVIIRINKRVH